MVGPPQSTQEVRMLETTSITKLLLHVALCLCILTTSLASVRPPSKLPCPLRSTYPLPRELHRHTVGGSIDLVCITPCAGKLCGETGATLTNSDRLIRKFILTLKAEYTLPGQHFNQEDRS